MFSVKVGSYSEERGVVQKGVLVFVRFKHKILVFPRPEIFSAKLFQFCSDYYCRVQTGFHKHQADERRRRAFPVHSGNADCFIKLCQFADCLGI